MANSARSNIKEVALLGKAMAIYEIGIRTYQAAMGAYNSQINIPVYGPVLAVGAAAAAVAFGAEQANAVAQIKPGFEFGGIVQGNSGSGDNVDVRANAGEAVMTEEQQGRLLDLADGNSGGGSQTIIVKVGEREITRAVVDGYNKGRNLDTVNKLSTG